MDYYFDLMKKKEAETKNRIEMQRIAQEEMRQYVGSEIFRANIRDIVIRELNMPQVQLIVDQNLKEQIRRQVTKILGDIKFK